MAINSGEASEGRANELIFDHQRNKTVPTKEQKEIKFESKFLCFLLHADCGCHVRCVCPGACASAAGIS